MKKYFLTLYQYNEWATSRVLKCLVDQKVDNEKILSLMGHVLAAQFLWLHRIKGLAAPDVKLWGTYSLQDLITMNEKIAKQWINFVESSEQFDRVLSYTNYTGQPFTNNVEMIMIHLVNHSSYHRAQVSMLLRQLGYEPVNTDFITYDRVISGQLKD
jgi:uncharacterized damage-inducible protein DinB